MPAARAPSATVAVRKFLDGRLIDPSAVSIFVESIDAKAPLRAGD